MTDALLQLGASNLRAVAVAIRGGRLASPFDSFAVHRILGATVAAGVADELRILGEGATPASLARFLEELARAAERHPRLEDRVQLVTTGVDVAGNRDTMVVVQDLFRRAERDVLVSGYAIHNGRRLFQPLVDRMSDQSGLRVRLFLNVSRAQDDLNPIDRFTKEFVRHHWPDGAALPEVWFDPRSLESDRSTRAVLHAKCVIIDRSEFLISSANLTEAAQIRNVEVGLLVRSNDLADQLTRFFDGLIAGNQLRRANIGRAS